MGHDSTPEDPRPGLDLSYSEVVGAVYEIVDAQVVRSGPELALFVPEQDRLQEELIARSLDEISPIRPETSGATMTQEQLSETSGYDPMAEEKPTGSGRTYVVPLRAPPPEPEGDGTEDDGGQ